MGGTRSSSRATVTRSSPRSSPRSGRSTPVRKPAGTPLKQSITTPKKSATKAKANGGKTSPYFPKVGKINGRSTRRRIKDESEDEEDREEDEEGASEASEESENSKADATGLTSSSSDSSGSSHSEDEFALSEDENGAEEDEDEEDAEEQMDSEMDSDNLDDDEDEDDAPRRKSKSKSSRSSKPTPTLKRKSVGTTNGGGTKRKKEENGHEPIPGYEDEDEYDSDEVDLEEGQEIAGRIYPAPKTGLVPPGRISQNTLNFLKNMQIPERNDREWFRSHEPAFRQAEKEWKMFVGIVQTKFAESDPEVPILPPNSVIHRIYRDVRFSSDKTPYKKSFSLSTSRGGRKGIWAAYHLSISPNNRSLLACGVWQPAKNELASIRHSFKTDPQGFRDIISEEEFVGLFGPPRVGEKGERRNVFGNDDALKVAPKGVEKDHKDIDLLKLRSVAVVHHFTDEEVIGEDFQDKIADVVRVMAPFVHRLNDMVTLPVGTADD